MAITAKDVAELRRQTGLGMMECKAALAETDGDVTAAVDLLRTRGLAKMEARVDRTSAEGRVAIALADDRRRGAIVQLNTETDFTANNDSFIKMTQSVADHALAGDLGEATTSQKMTDAIDETRLTTKENVQYARGVVLGGPDKRVGGYAHFNGRVAALIEVTGEVDADLLKDLCQHIVAHQPSPLALTQEHVPADIVAKEREIAKAQAMESGKPENIAEKMVEGKIRKFFDEVVLLRQAYIKDDKKQVQDMLPAGAKITAFCRYQVGG